MVLRVVGLVFMIDLEEQKGKDGGWNNYEGPGFWYPGKEASSLYVIKRSGFVVISKLKYFTHPLQILIFFERWLNEIISVQ